MSESQVQLVKDTITASEAAAILQMRKIGSNSRIEAMSEKEWGIVSDLRKIAFPRAGRTEDVLLKSNGVTVRVHPVGGQVS